MTKLSKSAQEWLKSLGEFEIQGKTAVGVHYSEERKLTWYMHPEDWRELGYAAFEIALYLENPKTE